MGFARRGLLWCRTAPRRLLGAARLRSIKSKITVFALIATLIPSVTMGWLSFRNNRQVIDEKIAQELAGLTSDAVAQLAPWLRERQYEVGVLASSYEVSENLERIDAPETAGRDVAASEVRLRDYLGSVGKKFPDYRELVVVGTDGKVVASSAERPGPLALPSDWLNRVRSDETVVGDPLWDRRLDSGTMVIADAIRAADDTFLGALCARVKLDEIGPILTLRGQEPSRALHLVTRRGATLFSSEKPEVPGEGATLDTATIDRLFAQDRTVLEFEGSDGMTVLGELRQIPETGWGVVAHLDQAQAYAEVVKLRNSTLALIFDVSLAIGLAAYLLCLTIVRPLDRLIQGATSVAEGNLDVRIPVHGSSEVTYATEVFNQMVAQLRQHRDERKAVTESLRERNSELHELSITDGLTGLHNRAYLPQVLDRELARAKRHRRLFSILMIDLDHFKWLNDTYGHLEGDTVLQGVAGIFRNSVRTADFAARYGGEEFLILLTETGPDGAMRFAERLRRKIERMPSLGQKAVTASIGVASFPIHGVSVEAIIREADNALYRCKQYGRNRVALAALAEVEETAPTGSEII